MGVDGKTIFLFYFFLTMLFCFVISVVEFIFRDNYQLKTFEFRFLDFEEFVFRSLRTSLFLTRFGSPVWVIFSRGENILKILSSVR